MNYTLTTNQKLTIDIKNLERKEHKHDIKENHQTAREETKRRTKDQRTTKTTRK